MKYLLLIVTAAIAVLFLFWKDVKDIFPDNVVVGNLKGGDNGSKKKGSAHISIIERWDMPSALREVSGIAYLDEHRIAAVQDELGTIFIFNTNTKRIEREISFGGKGDYEGLAIKENTAYVVTAGGTIYQVDLLRSPAAVKEFKTTLTEQNNVEGICYDVEHNRLLLSVKDEDPLNRGQKGIYAFDLSKMDFLSEAVYSINMQDPVFDKGKKKKEIMPSEIGIHPVSKELYITDGPNSRLLIMGQDGKTKDLIALGKDFEQPEGISFSPEGDIYISNEGKKDPGNILKVKVE